MADVTLTYKGSDILELSDSGSATLKTGGKYCEDDISVEYVKPSGGGEDAEYYMSILPDDSYVYAVMKPCSHSSIISFRQDATLSASCAENLNDTFEALNKERISGNLDIIKIEPHNNPLFVKIVTSTAYIGFSAFADAYAVKDNLTTELPATPFAVSPPNCDYYLQTKNHSGNTAISYSFRTTGAKKSILKISSFTPSNNLGLFEGTSCEEIEMDNVSTSVKLPEKNALKFVRLRNWTFTGSRFNDGLIFPNAVALDVSGLNIGTATNINGCFGTMPNVVTINLSNVDLSNATQAIGFLNSCESLLNVVTDNNTIFPQTAINASVSSLLSDESLINIANALNPIAKTLTLHSTPKNRLAIIMGTVTSGTFTADESGTVTLMDFITNTKGWTVA